MRALFCLCLMFSLSAEYEPPCNNLLVSDFSQASCTALDAGDLTHYYWLNEEEDCIPSCKEYAEEGHNRKDCPCPPAYSCEQRCDGIVENSKIRCTTNDDCPVRSRCKFMCIASSGGCMAYHANTEDFKYEYYTALKFKPTCTTKGLWEAKQCKGGVSGRCFCFDKDGNRLFGQAKYSESTDMTCACSRRKAELEASGRYYVSFHCDSMGNYEKLQCDSAAGLCWCVEPKTGDLTSAVVPEKAMKKLPCYNVANVGAQYLRQCDSTKFAMSKVMNTLKLHGVTYVSLGTLLCDGDGGYGAYSINSGIAYCTWRDGSKIGTWQSDSSADISTLTCNCARDYKLYSHLLACEGNGNYNTIQSVVWSGTTSYYCVDSDGFTKTDLINEKPANCSDYY